MSRQPRSMSASGGVPVTHQNQFCDGIHRRDLLRIGAAGLLGTGLSLADLLKLQAEQPDARRDVSLIIVFLKGGLSTIDTFDLKPEAPAEFRGEFGPIATNVPGT